MGRNIIRVVKTGLIDYEEALEMQQSLLAKRQAGKVCDTLLIVEHYPVITVGRSGNRDNIVASRADLEANGVKVHDISRGGDVTYHGPGQIVGYPVMDLSERGRDIRRYVHEMEEVFIRLLDREFGIEAHRGENKYTGVWVGFEKITAIGIAVKKWVTMHGFAFNVNTDLDHFKWIVPCGLGDRGVTSLARILGKRPDMDAVIEMVISYFCEVFDLDGNTA